MKRSYLLKNFRLLFCFCCCCCCWRFYVSVTHDDLLLWPTTNNCKTLQFADVCIYVVWMEVPILIPIPMAITIHTTDHSTRNPPGQHNVWFCKYTSGNLQKSSDDDGSCIKFYLHRICFATNLLFFSNHLKRGMKIWEKQSNFNAEWKEFIFHH